MYVNAIFLDPQGTLNISLSHCFFVQPQPSDYLHLNKIQILGNYPQTLPDLAFPCLSSFISGHLPFPGIQSTTVNF